MTVLFILPKTVSFLRNKSCSCTTCIVYVNLFKDRFFYVGFLFRKADAKVKTFKYIFQIFSEVFFHLPFFPSSLLRKGEQGKDCFTDPDSRKSVNQRCLLFESGCKGKNFITYLPNVSGSFFSFRMLYSWSELRQKKRKTLEFLRRFCQNVNFKAYRLLESGCKSSRYIHSLQTYLSFFRNFFETIS